MSEEWTNKEVRKMDEIDALTADRNWLTAMLRSALRVARRLRAERDALKAERDRYREALKMFIEHDEECVRDYNWCSCGAYAARAALKK